MAQPLRWWFVAVVLMAALLLWRSSEPTGCPAECRTLPASIAETKDTPKPTVAEITQNHLVSLTALDLAAGDRLVLYRRKQPYYHQTQLPHEWIIVKSVTDPPFLQVIGDPQADHMVSSMLWDGWYEPPVSELFIHLLEKRCSPLTHRVLDVGSNLGWFSLLAASRGYEVVAFEPQDHVVELLRRGIALNDFSDRIFLHHGPVGSDGAKVALRDGGTNWGGASVRLAPENNGDGGSSGGGSVSISISISGTLTTISLDTSLRLLDRGKWPTHKRSSLLPAAPICILKIDVEGFEPEVFVAAKTTLAQTENIVMEFRDNDGGRHALEMLRDAGFDSMLILDDECCHGKSGALFLESPLVATSVEALREQMRAIRGQLNRVDRENEYVNLAVFRSK